MRLFLLSVYVILGSQLLLSVLNMDMNNKINERNAALERLTNSLNKDR